MRISSIALIKIADEPKCVGLVENMNFPLLYSRVLQHESVRGRGSCFDNIVRSKYTIHHSRMD